ncbi:hypothetical protein EV122DRAFT_250084 [Schizophyllum commune]
MPSAFDAASAGSIHRLLARLPINLTATRSLVAPLALLDATGSSLVLVRLPKPSTRSRTPLGLHSRPFAPTYDSLLALDHDGGDDDEGEEERRAWPGRTEETAARRARSSRWCPCPMRLTMPSSAMLGAKIGSSWRLWGDSTLTVTRRDDLDAYMRRLRALVNADGRVTRRQTRDPEPFLSMLSHTGVRLCAPLARGSGEGRSPVTSRVGRGALLAKGSFVLVDISAPIRGRGASKTR